MITPDQIKALRKSYPGTNDEQLQACANDIGISVYLLRDWESGRHKPKGPAEKWVNHLIKTRKITIRARG